MMTILVLMLLTAYIYAVAAVYLLEEMDQEYYGTVAFSIRVMLQIKTVGPRSIFDSSQILENPYGF